ncbi:hypothetical protein CANARDRAFT_28761 [[Candida] arabinofermentans NRRL YB-2248]|uniref:Pro-apoptotic serine protease NMA111 n=1 Tax=[Candida] arabinofermentans NRRL YB-2248 TaxID=983967 RepID=A0A1E4T009_9ASCO|nr:hypothetical protein CANARDRAFT_28761 [[Candida] arabinofermentans NRRL YB-2248]
MDSLVPQKRSSEDDTPLEVNGFSKKSRDEDVSMHSPVDDETSASEDEDIGVLEYESAAATSNDPKWQKTVENVVKSVVSIHFSQVANFDTESALCSEATGFIVDAKLGIILTNRHVVGPGPFVGYAVFDNHEECEVKPIYRDPVHDFGFLKFNPEDIKYMEVRELALRPDLAKVGCEIRVIGNDSGEKLSILSGFISRLDRNTPDYGPNTYNDFNTEYIQAAASASGGSSGSPVVNCDGYAVALQAGGNSESSTDFFLPVYRVLRALNCVQNNEPITRGTIQVQWMLEPFDKCRRLGLRADSEKAMREKFPALNGLLVSSITLPEGPADGLIKEGDCLLAINGEPISTFIKVDDILDSHIGQEIEIEIQRGGKDMKVKCTVGDLHKITPNRYLSVCGATFNDLSYQLARLYSIPVKGLYVNNASGSFSLNNIVNGWIFDSIDDKDTPDLDTFIEVMKNIPDRAYVTLKYRHLSDLHVPLFKVVCIDRHWNSSFRLATRNDDTGLWDFTDLQDKPLDAPELTPKNAKFIDLPIEFESCKQLDRSFALVHSTIPIPLDSFSGHNRRVYGVVIDAEKGYIFTSRHCVPHDLVDITVTISESIIIPGKVVFLHPTKGYAIVKYDPSLVLAPVQTPQFSDKALERGEKIIFIGYNKNLRVVVDETKVSDIAVINLPTNATSPRFKATNIEAILIDSNLGQQCGSGLLCNKEGQVKAFWLAFDGDEDKVYSMGIDVTDVMWELEFLKNGQLPNLKVIDVEFCSVSILSARITGVPEEWISKIEEKCTDKLQLMSVPKISIKLDNKPSCELKHGDTILSVNDKLITRFRDIDLVIRNLATDVDEVDFKIVRHKQVMNLKVKLSNTSEFTTSQVVYWCGAVLQEPHHGVRQVIKSLPSGVYCTAMTQGSPSRFYTIGVTNFITHVNEQPTPNLNEFLKVIKSIKEKSYCKIRIVSFDNIPFAQTLKVNYHYFPTSELLKDPETKEWKEIEIEAEK